MMFKIYMVSICKKQFSRRGLWYYLQANPTTVAACGLPQVPYRRTLDRRVAEIATHSEEQIRALGLVLSLEYITDSRTSASDGSVFKAKGPAWHKSDQASGHIPYDDGKLIERCEQCGIEVLVPLSKAIGSQPPKSAVNGRLIYNRSWGKSAIDNAAPVLSHFLAPSKSFSG